MSGDAVALYRAGALSPEVTLARLLLAGKSPDEIAAHLAAEPGTGPLRALAEMHHDGLDRLSGMLAQVSHEGPGIDAIRQMFDCAVVHSPEASVAAYSLNDPAILAAATMELVDWLDAERLLRSDADVLDFGCGIGRVAAAIAPRTRSVLGVDVSPAMIAEAERRREAINVRFQVGGGTGLDLGTADAFDLILAIDSVPYLVQAGVADDHMRDISRVLRPGGAFVIFNLSYRNDRARDDADLALWSRKHGLLMTVNGVAPFKLWDGVGFVLRKS